MTEAEWEQTTDLDSLLRVIGSKGSERKWILWGVACCRRVWNRMTDPRHRQVVEAAERLADGILTAQAFEEAREPVITLWANQPDGTIKGSWELWHYMTAAALHLGSGGGAEYTASFIARGIACLAGQEENPAWELARAAEEAAQCDLLRDLFGKPFVPFRFHPDWLSGPGAAAVELARTMYRESRFDTLTLLADVLERSGCRHAAVLEHCRRPGPHIRGCWVVDALLEHEPSLQIGLLSEADWQACVDFRLLLHFLRDKGSPRKWRLFNVACCRRIDHLITDERSRCAVAVAARHADAAVSGQELEAVFTSATQAWDELSREEYMAEAEANFCTTPAYAKVSFRLYAATAACKTLSLVTQAEDCGSEDPDTGERSLSSFWAAAAVHDSRLAASEGIESETSDAQAEAAAEAARAAEEKVQCELLHDLFGDLLGPPGEKGSWLPFWNPDRHSGGNQWCLLPTPRKIILRPEWLAWNKGVVLRLAQHIYDEEAFDRLPILADALEDAGCTDTQLLSHLRSSAAHTRGCWALDALLGKN